MRPKRPDTGRLKSIPAELILQLPLNALEVACLQINMLGKFRGERLGKHGELVFAVRRLTLRFHRGRVAHSLRYLDEGLAQP